MVITILRNVPKMSLKVSLNVPQGQIVDPQKVKE